MIQIPEQAKPYLKGIWFVICFAVLLWFISKDKGFSCDDYAKAYKNEAEFHMILTRKENHNSRNSYFYGIDIKNKLPTEYQDGGGWIAHNFDKFDIGDTVIKNKGEYTITVKKKSKVISIPFQCTDKVYKDTLGIK